MSHRIAVPCVLALALALATACRGEALPAAGPAAAGANGTAGAAATTVFPGAGPVGDVAPTSLTADEKVRDQALVPKASATVEAFANFGASLSDDGRRVLFGSDRGGLSELYVSDIGATGAPVKIAGGDERAVSGRFTHDGKYVVFLRDKGADENFHVYRCRVDGSDTFDLTPSGTLRRDDVLLPRGSADTIVYTAHDPSSPGTLLFVQAIEGQPKVAYTEPTPAYGADVSPDASRALLVRDVSLSDQIVVEVDLRSGKARQIYPAEGKRAGVGAVAYSFDARRILVATDEGGERYSLLSLDGKTGSPVARYRVDRPATATLAAIDVSPRGDLVAIAVDAGNYSEARILDARTLTPKIAVKAPLGAIELAVANHAMPFSNDGKSFVLSASTPDKPGDVYLVDAAVGTVKPLRDDARPGLGDLPPISVATETTPAFDGLSIPLNVYRPRDTAPDKKLPVLVQFHGGPAASAALNWDPVARFFTSLGYAVVSPNIRGSTGFGRAFVLADNRERRADAMKDVETVNRWIRAQPWADPGRIAIFGFSQGGYMTLMGLTRQPGIWGAGVDAFGTADLKTSLQSADQGLRSVFTEEFGDVDRDPGLLEAFSPLGDVDKIRAPLFVYQGQNDPRVRRAQSDLIVSKLRARGVPVEYMVAMNEGHSLEHRENQVEFLTRVARFLNERMK
jgi:dipeptidyl aminopeptidase/acylaminoacyl peptidase